MNYMPEEIEKQETSRPETENTGRQEQADPPITELRGFTDPSEDLEPVLTDGTKAPDKAEKENRENEGR
jgi:hypothetical protein